MPRRKTTTKLVGKGLRAYFDGVLETEAELGAAPRRRLSDTLVREISQARVRTPFAVRRRPATLVVDAPVLPREAGAGAHPAAAAPSRPAAPGVSPPQASAAVQPAAAPPFNPYAFSAVAVMTRGGRDALLARLDAIADAANLRKLAAAQHVAIPSDMQAATPAELRAAIIDGVANRIADRRAAAS